MKAAYTNTLPFRLKECGIPVCALLDIRPLGPEPTVVEAAPQHAVRSQPRQFQAGVPSSHCSIDVGTNRQHPIMRFHDDPAGRGVSSLLKTLNYFVN